MELDINHNDIVRTVVYLMVAFVSLIATLLLFVLFLRKKMSQTKYTVDNSIVEQPDEIKKIIINTQERERDRIARDLHDGIGSKLSVILLNLNYLSQSTANESYKYEILEDTKLACEQLVESTRRISHELIPPVLEKIGLHAIFIEFFDQISKAGNIEFNYKNINEEKVFEQLSLEEKSHLYRIIQELVANSIKHGKADQISLLIQQKVGFVRVHYIDNGVGMQLFLDNQKNTLGLQNIMLRAKILNTIPVLKSENGAGFEFILEY